MMRKTRVLVVCQWPLGGIRTYLKYNYQLFPKDEFDITLLANPSIEKESVKKDMDIADVKVIWAQPLLGRNVLSWRTFTTLLKDRFDLIHSQGFISAFHVAMVNWLFRKPHVLTIHGILEDKYFSGGLGRLKRRALGFAFRNVTVFHGVGHDILEHFGNGFPRLRRGKARWIAITNGIKSERFVDEIPDTAVNLRAQHNLKVDTTVFGFFGRFMPQKGFNYIIDAVRLLHGQMSVPSDFVVLAVGSGDYEKEYKDDVRQTGLSDRFRFMSFTPAVYEIMKGCDAVLMPSVWEAYPILSSEVLCSGIPLIASDCIGLREATKDTPTITIPAHNVEALAEAMASIIQQPQIKDRFKTYQMEAARKFDVSNFAAQLVELFRETLR
jgi:glycosyltransferase involved in cell wall biosynthesis